VLLPVPPKVGDCDDQRRAPNPAAYDECPVSARLVHRVAREERIERERQLRVDEAVLIAREVADALGYAHGLGIIHRDI